MAYIYDPKNKFGYKDTLPEGHPEKIIRGAEFDDEFKRIAGAFAILDPDGDGDISIDSIDGLQDALDKERQERIEADADLQGQIDALDPNSDRSVGWDEIQDKPTEFPPESHGHEIADVNGLQDALDSVGGTPAWDDVTGKPTEFPPAAHNQDWSTITNTPSDYPPSAHDHAWDDVTGKPADYPPSAHDHAWSEITGKPSEFPPETHGHEIADVNGLQDALNAAGGAPAWDDVTGKPTEYPPEAHTHEQSEVDGLEDRLTLIESSINSGGGFVEAPNDGKLYGRQSEAWAEVVIPDAGASSWNDLTDKPTEFPPEAHDQGWDTITGKPADYPPSAHDHAWDQITGKPTEFPPASHDHDGVYQPVGDYIEDADSDGKQYARQDGAWSEIVIPDGGSGSSVHIGDTPPASPSEGQQWMEVPTSGDAVMWIYDGAKWLQQPGGKDGAPGADGNIADATTDGVIATWNNTSGQWTPDSNLTIDAGGEAIFSGNVHVGDLGGHHNFSVGQGDKAFSINPIAPSSNTESSDGYTDVVRVNAYDWGAKKTLPLGLRCEKLYIDNSGQGQMLSIDGVTKEAKFSGNVSAPDFIATSDERVKDNITTAPVGLIDGLKGREWDWSESGEKGSGVVAQELEQVLPHLVHEDEDGMKSVSYNGLVAYLIEEVKALRAEVEALK